MGSRVPPTGVVVLLFAMGLLLGGCVYEFEVHEKPGDHGEDDDTDPGDDDAGDDDGDPGDDDGDPGDDDGDPGDDDGDPGDDDGGPGDDDAGDDDTGGAYCYTEPIDPSASLQDLENGFNGGNWLATILEVTDRRYPSGHLLLTIMQNDPYLSWFVDTSSFPYLMDSLGTVVHEETHGYDYEHALWSQHFGYFVNTDWQPSVPFHEGFERGEIYAMVQGNACDLYTDTYLTGMQGTYNFMELLDELNAYINGLAALALVGEYEPWAGVSARDGPLALMYFLQLYLERARTVYPSFYSQIQGDPHVTDLVLIQWLRLHFFLDVSYAFPELGIHDHEIEQLVHDPTHVWEIENLTGHAVQDSNCLLPGDPYQPPF